jgi:hypothetical protein
MSQALDKPIAMQLRAGYQASRKYYRFAAGAMTALTVAMAALCAATASWGYLALACAMLVPLTAFIVYRTAKLPGPDVLEAALAEPERVTTILKLVTPRTRILGVEIDGAILPLRFDTEAELDRARRGLAEKATKATLVPPLDEK